MKEERIIVIVGIHEKGTVCSTYGTILLSKMVSHLNPQLLVVRCAGKIDGSFCTVIMGPHQKLRWLKE